MADLCWTITSALDAGVTVPTLIFANFSSRGLCSNELRLFSHCKIRSSPGISSRVTNEGVVLKGMISSTRPQESCLSRSSRSSEHHPATCNYDPISPRSIPCFFRGIQKLRRISPLPNKPQRSSYQQAGIFQAQRGKMGGPSPPVPPELDNGPYQGEQAGNSNASSYLGALLTRLGNGTKIKQDHYWMGSLTQSLLHPRYTCQHLGSH